MNIIYKSQYYIIQRNGLLIQWGRYVGVIKDDASVNISFPMAFGTMGNVIISAFDTDNNGKKSMFIILESNSHDGTSNIIKTRFRVCNTDDYIAGFFQFAIGY